MVDKSPTIDISSPRRDTHRLIKTSSLLGKGEGWQPDTVYPESTISKEEDCFVKTVKRDPINGLPSRRRQARRREQKTRFRRNRGLTASRRAIQSVDRLTTDGENPPSERKHTHARGDRVLSPTGRK